MVDKILCFAKLFIYVEGGFIKTFYIIGAFKYRDWRDNIIKYYIIKITIRHD